MREFDYVELGATLFIPASHKNLQDIITRKKYKNLKSLVIDFEDGLDDFEIDKSLKNLDILLQSIDFSSPFIFLRPRNIEMLKDFLNFKYIKNIDGFIFAKLSLKNVDDYFSLIKNSNYKVMPSIEGEELFDIVKLIELKDKLLIYKNSILLVRFGLEDMLKRLMITRECGESVFDICVTSSILGSFISIFRGSGFAISGGVYKCFLDDDGFLDDVRRDIKESLFSKTIIHPRQIDLAHQCYKVTQKELDEANEILDSKKTIFSQNFKMAEKTTMTPYAKFILKRANIYGVTLV